MLPGVCHANKALDFEIHFKVNLSLVLCFQMPSSASSKVNIIKIHQAKSHRSCWAAFKLGQLVDISDLAGLEPYTSMACTLGLASS